MAGGGDGGCGCFPWGRKKRSSAPPTALRGGSAVNAGHSEFAKGTLRAAAANSISGAAPEIAPRRRASAFSVPDDSTRSRGDASSDSTDTVSDSDAERYVPPTARGGRTGSAGGSAVGAPPYAPRAASAAGSVPYASRRGSAAGPPLPGSRDGRPPSSAHEGAGYGGGGGPHAAGSRGASASDAGGGGDGELLDAASRLEALRARNRRRASEVLGAQEAADGGGGGAIPAAPAAAAAAAAGMYYGSGGGADGGSNRVHDVSHDPITFDSFSTAQRTHTYGAHHAPPRLAPLGGAPGGAGRLRPLPLFESPVHSRTNSVTVGGLGAIPGSLPSMTRPVLPPPPAAAAARNGDAGHSAHLGPLAVSRFGPALGPHAPPPPALSLWGSEGPADSGATSPADLSRAVQYPLRASGDGYDSGYGAAGGRHVHGLTAEADSGYSAVYHSDGGSGGGSSYYGAAGAAAAPQPHRISGASRMGGGGYQYGATADAMPLPRTSGFGSGAGGAGGGVAVRTSHGPVGYSSAAAQAHPFGGEVSFRLSSNGRALDRFTSNDGRGLGRLPSNGRGAFAPAASSNAGRRLERNASSGVSRFSTGAGGGGLGGMAAAAGLQQQHEHYSQQQQQQQQQQQVEAPQDAHGMGRTPYDNPAPPLRADYYAPQQQEDYGHPYGHAAATTMAAAAAEEEVDAQHPAGAYQLPTATTAPEPISSPDAAPARASASVGGAGPGPGAGAGAGAGAAGDAPGASAAYSTPAQSAAATAIAQRMEAAKANEALLASLLGGKKGGLDFASVHVKAGGGGTADELERFDRVQEAMSRLDQILAGPAPSTALGGGGRELSTRAGALEDAQRDFEGAALPASEPAMLVRPW